MWRHFNAPRSSGAGGCCALMLKFRKFAIVAAVDCRSQGRALNMERSGRGVSERSLSSIFFASPQAGSKQRSPEMTRQLAGVTPTETRRDGGQRQPFVEVGAASKRPIGAQIFARQALDLVGREHDVAQENAGD